MIHKHVLYTTQLPRLLIRVDWYLWHRNYAWKLWINNINSIHVFVIGRLQFMLFQSKLRNYKLYQWNLFQNIYQFIQHLYAYVINWFTDLFWFFTDGEWHHLQWMPTTHHPKMKLCFLLVSFKLLSMTRISQSRSQINYNHGIFVWGTFYDLMNEEILENYILPAESRHLKVTKYTLLNKMIRIIKSLDKSKVKSTTFTVLLD